MSRHADGDDEAFAELVRRHRDRLWAVALRTLGDREEAADALQDALLSALRAGRAGSFRGDAAVTTWLHRIVVNACLDRVRRRSARPADPLGEDAARLPDPTDRVGRRETALVVDRGAGHPAGRAARGAGPGGHAGLLGRRGGRHPRLRRRARSRAAARGAGPGCCPLVRDLRPGGEAAAHGSDGVRRVPNRGSASGVGPDDRPLRGR